MKSPMPASDSNAVVKSPVTKKLFVSGHALHLKKHRHFDFVKNLGFSLEMKILK